MLIAEPIDTFLVFVSPDTRMDLMADMLTVRMSTHEYSINLIGSDSALASVTGLAARFRGS